MANQIVYTYPWGNPIKGSFICLTRDLYSSLQEVRWSSYLIKILTQNQERNFFKKGENNLLGRVVQSWVKITQG